jgi:hypothetical protein
MSAGKAFKWRSSMSRSLSKCPLQLNLRAIVTASLVVIGQAGNPSPSWRRLLTAVVPRGGLAHV